MTLTKLQITRLRKIADMQPATDAVLLWFFVWVVIACGLMWLFAERAFPVYDGAQGVALSWVGMLITTGGLIAAGLCYFLYKFLLYRKEAAIQELKALITDNRSGDV